MPEDGAAPVVNVIATTCEGTRAALRRARQLTVALPPRVVLLVPLMGAAAEEQAFGRGRHPHVAECRALAAECGLDADVLGCVCERETDLVPTMLNHASPVVVGGRYGSWWPSREERLAWRLMAQGYPVAFARESGGAVARRWFPLRKA
jgi:hypothetical protein